MKPIGIYYFDYAAGLYPRSARKMIIGYTRQDLLDKITEQNIPSDWVAWLWECNTPIVLIQGKISLVTEWINQHIPDTFGEPLVP